MRRQQQRRILRKAAEQGIGPVAGKVPRSTRRLIGRAYGNAAYRQLHDLSHILYGDGPNGYSGYVLNRTLVNWLATEWEKYEQTQQNQAEEPANDSPSSDVDIPSHDGSTGDPEVVAE